MIITDFLFLKIFRFILKFPSDIQYRVSIISIRVVINMERGRLIARDKISKK